MRKILISLFIVLSLQSYSQVKVSEILAYEYNNQKNTFTPNVVGKASSDIEGSGNQTLVVIKLNRIPGSEYQYIERKLKVTAQSESNGSVEIYEQKELIIPIVEETFFIPLLIQKGTTGLTIKAELYEKEKLVSTKKQFLVKWSGD